SLAAWAILPFAREGRRFVPLDYGYHPVAMGPGLHWGLPVAAVLIIGLYLFGPVLAIAPRKRGDLAFGLAAVASIASVWWLLAGGVPFGWGAMGATLGMIVAAVAALSDGGRVRDDAFVGASILLMLLFVTMFITVPLFMVMRSAVWIEGEFTLAQFTTTFGSSL